MKIPTQKKYFGCFGLRGERGCLNCDDICVSVVHKQFELLEFVFDSVYVDLQLSLCGICSPLVVLGLSVRLWWYPML